MDDDKQQSIIAFFFLTGRPPPVCLWCVMVKNLMKHWIDFSETQSNQWMYIYNWLAIGPKLIEYG